MALLQRHGFSTTVTHAAAAADLLLPAKGGSLAYLLWSGRAATQQLVERAAAAARAARRCTVLWVGPLDEWRPVDELQSAAKAVGNDELYLTFSEGAKLIQRDIVYAPSLYLES